MTKTKYVPVFTPKAHQEVAIARMINGPVANFDDQGLGKCKQAYDTGARLLASGVISLMVFVVKASLRDNTLKEVEADGRQLRAVIINGNKLERTQQYRFLAHHVIIVSYETVSTDVEILETLFERNSVGIFFDEAHSVKNFKANRTQACLRLAKIAKRSFIFSGTPIPNKRVDAFSQLKLAGFNVGDTPQEFREKFQSNEALREFLGGKFIRRRKEDLKELNLPSKTIYKVAVELSGKQRQAYDLAKNQMIVRLRAEAKRCGYIDVPIEGILAQLTKLNQLASNPRLLTDTYTADPAKFKALDKLVRGPTGKANQKVIIWTCYKKNVRELMERYSDLGAVALYSEVSKLDRVENCRKFKEEEGCRVLIAIPACAREGFTLTSASKAIYVDRNFSYLDWAQSQDRIHRISQVNKCRIYVLEAAKTIDVRINEVLEKKQALQRFLLGESDIEDDGQRITIQEAINLLE